MKRLLLITLLLTGCAAQQPLVHPYATQAQVNQDNLACRYEALKVEASVQNPIIGMSMANDAMRMCLQMRGYK